MAHVFTFLAFVDHEYFRNPTQDLGSRLRLVGRSKLPWSLIPAENQSVDRSVIERLKIKGCSN